jgi:ABC-type antimicrobial peptide transport system permease subunit
MTMLLPSVRIALGTLRANPLRTALSTLGIVMGAASLAAVLSLGDGVEQFTRQRLEQEGMQVIAIEPRTSDEVDGLRVPRTDYPVFTSSDADRLAAHIGPRHAVLMLVRGTGLLSGATGDRPRRAIVVQFLAESVAISLTGSVVGVTLGLSGAFAVTALMRARTEALVYAAVTWQTIVVSALAALAVGLLFGTYPALRAARLSPEDAMRHE